MSLGGLWGEAIPGAVVDAAQDPAILAQVADVFRRNCRSAEGLRRQPETAEALRLAERVMATLLDPDRLQMADVAGLRFYLQLGTQLYPGPNLVLANAWDGVQWRPVAEIRLPGGVSDPQG